MATSHMRSRQLKMRENEISPERTKVWTEPKSKLSEKRTLPIVYYLSRNGFLEHPHFMELTLSSNQPLFLKDFINRLNALRGKGIASSFSWSCKRSYKNGFVWQDLAEDDLIHPAHGHEYILKGSEIVNLSSSSSFEKPLEIPKSKAKTPWSSVDLNEYKVHKSDLNADAATQTEETRNRRRVESDEREEIEIEAESEIEISPPPSSSSSSAEMTEMKVDGRLTAVGSGELDRTAGGFSSGRFGAAAVMNLMQLVSCGSISVKERGGSVADAERETRGVRDPDVKEMDGLIEKGGFGCKEYFSGSLVEMKKKGDGGATCPKLKRSNSFDAAGRSSKVEVSDEEEVEGVRAKCIPRKRASGGRREGGSSSSSSSSISRSSQGSKRLDDVPF